MGQAEAEEQEEMQRKRRMISDKLAENPRVSGYLYCYNSRCTHRFHPRGDGVSHWLWGMLDNGPACRWNGFRCRCWANLNRRFGRGSDPCTAAGEGHLLAFESRHGGCPPPFCSPFVFTLLLPFLFFWLKDFSFPFQRLLCWSAIRKQLCDKKTIVRGRFQTSYSDDPIGVEIRCENALFLDHNRAEIYVCSKSSSCSENWKVKP